ncbi:MAG TPA: antibiotic biosynthesis monooxygenase [Terriglobales bacterium]|jgi:quinol monooxygenase YgiN|nr:antibiotic biosynthesis monooxygenase [Terriglobales bacterium]
MPAQRVYVLVELTVHDGKFSDFASIAQEMTAGTEKEPGTLGYEWHLSRDRKLCRLLETYADANALLTHFKGAVVQQLVPRALEFAGVDRFEVYGDPGAEATAMLANFGAQIFDRWQGLDR